VSRKTLTYIGLFFGVTLAILFWCAASGPSYGQIRLDSGDLRYFYFGIPVYDPMPEPYRSQIRGLSQNSPILKSQWVTCVVYPLEGSNNPDKMIRRFYYNATAWIKEDPHLASLILNDVGKYVIDAARKDYPGGLPESSELLSGMIVQYNAAGDVAVNPDWRADEGVSEYLKAKGYTPPATRPIGN
jgi:hypothetical protein